MLKRTLTGLVILLLTALSIWSRSFSIFFFDFFVMLISFVATYEMIKLYIKKDNADVPIKNRSYIYLSLIYCYLVYMCYALAKTILYAICYQIVCALIIFIIAFVIDIIYLGKLRKNGIEIDKDKYLYSTFSTLKLMIYPITLIATLYGFGLNGMDKAFGTTMVILVFAVTMLTDVFAYLFGMAFHKGVLCSQLSPKKSISGAIGGIVGGLVASAGVFLVCQFLLNVNPFNEYSLFRIILFFSISGVLGSITTQIGDLVASTFKRRSDIKDYGHIFPGHGGMMDRIDGLMFTSTLIFITMTLVFLI